MDFRKLIVGTVLALACHQPVAAAKLDIRGFTTRMSQEDCAKARIALSEEDAGALAFKFSDLGQKPLKEVQYAFKSGTSMEEMTALVAKQYGVPPPSAAAIAVAIKSVKHGRPVYSPGWFGMAKGLVLVPGGMLAKWRLTKDIVLQLNAENDKPPFEYRLYLTDEGIESEERRAKADQTARANAAKRAVNPAPKF